MIKTPPVPPLTFCPLTPEHVTTSTKSAIEASASLYFKLWKSTDRPAAATFASVIEPLIVNTNEAKRDFFALTLLSSVSPKLEIRDAARFAIETIKVREGDATVQLHVKQLGSHVLNNRETIEPAHEHLFYAEHKMVVEELRRLLLASQQAIEIENRKDGVAVSKSYLDGLPADVLSTMKVVDSYNQQVWVKFSSHERLILEFVSLSETRKWMHTASRMQFPESVARLHKIVVLRDKIARMLGFDHYAAQTMHEMAVSAERARKDLGLLRDKLQGLMNRQLLRLEQLKQEDLVNCASLADYHGTIFPWDWEYYRRRLVEREVKPSYTAFMAELKEYFEVGHTVSELLSLVSAFFGLEFIRVEDAPNPWHADVAVIAVWDKAAPHSQAGSDFLGYIYLDLLERPGKDKQGGIGVVSPSFGYPDGRRSYPAVALVCSFGPASSAKTTLLSHYDVRTMLRLLGKAVHRLVSTDKYNLPLSIDFEEIPGFLLEHWAWSACVLKKLGRHHKNGSELPDRLINNLGTVRDLYESPNLLFLVHLALFDLAIHAPESHEVVQEMDMTDRWVDIERQVFRLPLERSEYNCFGQAGILAFYHDTHKNCVANVISQTYAWLIYARHFTDDPVNPAEGLRYRRMVLEHGASKPEWNMLTAYMGME
ncbi:peptidase family M3-domain-containing protein [Podospora aff. communis PSN243]|uniref:Peptidase family M3-domain-containing protein n=1 Tax=Podospora aff. communis PSN243 TaxID=3040156 RepID=A0AAV9GS58_9PEZI|nr:peptidase family M3-domain-containing protein [Podospora aff. communis PSN243]